MSDIHIPNPLQSYIDRLLFVSFKKKKNGEIESCKYDLKKDVENLHSAYYTLFPYDCEASNSKHAFMDAIANRFPKRDSIYEPLLNQELVRKKEALESLKGQGYYIEPIRLKTASRLIVGLGEDSPYEVGMTLHHVYGYPYIPSTAVKGLCRAWLEVAEDTFEGEILTEPNLTDKIQEEAKTVFGSNSKDEKVHKGETQLGGVLFLDAIPTSFPKLEVDIMTPHYQPYYENPKNNPPGDWYSPVPIPFLTVAPGTEFWFGLASRNSSVLEKAKEWLINGLTELGIGAKTSSGYGYFVDEEAIKEREKGVPGDQQGSGERHAQVESKLKEIPEFNTVSQGTSGIVAEVAKCDKKPIKVRLLNVKGAKELVDCAINNLDAVEPGQKIMVNVSQYNKKKKKIQMTTYMGDWE